MMKKTNVLMLPTDNQYQGSLCVTLEGKLHGNVLIGIPQHLYFVTDDEIQKGDEGCYILHPATNTILQIKEFLTDGLRCENIETRTEHGLGMNYKSWKKILATTKPDLWKDWDVIRDWDKREWDNVPKIPTDFIQAYVREQGKIKEVMLEYEETVMPDRENTIKAITFQPGVKTQFTPKLRFNGTVIIHRVKEKKYTREEVKKMINSFIVSWIGEYNNYNRESSVEEWLNKNYPE